jgi:type II secretory pathway component GspD/PulD (secretin)
MALSVFNFQASRFSINQSPDQQSVIITVNSERTLENGTKKAGGAATTLSSAEMNVEFIDGKLTMDTLRAPLLPLLSEIARKTGINLAVDDRNLAYESEAQKGKLVSLSLKSLPVDDVMRTIAKAYGLALSQGPDGAYLISDGVPTSLSSYRLSDTRSYPMKFIRAQTASGLLPTFLFSYLHVNSEQNAVVVSAPTQMLEKIGKDLGTVDLAPPQIMMECLAVELSNNRDLSSLLQTSWTTPGITLGTDSGTGSINYSTVGRLPRDFSARLQSLVAQGKARIRSKPRMAAVNGQRANVFIGSQKFILVKYQSYGGTSEKIQGVDVGVKLNITPWTGGNGEVTSQVEAEVSNISDVDGQTGLPVLSTRRAETTIRVKDGETVVIGGLVLKEVFDTKRKVPLLGDIPFLGYAFRSRLRQETESELAIFVTPHILTDKGRLKDDQEEQRIRDKMLKENAGG